MFRKCAPMICQTMCRQSSFWHPYKWSSRESAIFDAFHRMKQNMKHDLRDTGHSAERVCPFRKPFFTVPDFSKFHDSFQPEKLIVEEGGRKKFKLTVDIAQFSPNEVEVKTNKGKVIIKAIRESKDESRNSKFEYRREYSVPEGVKLEDLTCKYLENENNIVLEAPYNEPIAKATKEQSIPVKHEK